MRGFRRFTCAVVVGASCIVGISGGAQTAAASPPQPALTFRPSPLEYGKPKLVMGLSRMSGMVGAFQCTSSGGVVAEVNVETDQLDSTGHSPSRILLLIVRPDGTTTSLPWSSVPGYDKVYSPRRVFAGGGMVYALVKATKQETGSDVAVQPALFPLLLGFDESGTLKSVVKLRSDFSPASFGVFPSGNILVVSKDELNHRMKVSILKPDGEFQRDLQLGPDDYLEHKDATVDGSQGALPVSPDFLIGSTEVYSHGQNLLLIPRVSSRLPILEVSEGSVVRAIVPQLPKGSLIAGFVPSSGAYWKLRLGAVNDFAYKYRNEDGIASGVGVNLTTIVVSVNPADGAIMGAVDLGSLSVYPACAEDKDYTLLTSHYEDGQLQIVEASPR